MDEQSSLLAVIDVGTLKSKFEIRSYQDVGRYVSIYKDKKLTVLGRDLPKTNGLIVEKAVDTTTEALYEFKQIMDEFGVNRYRAVTTEAVRAAKNANQVLLQIRDATGIDLEVLSHADEASIFFNHVSKSFPGKVIAVTDVGGGSVQVVIGRDGEVFHSFLFKTGSYFMQETFSKTHHPTPEEQATAVAYVKQEYSKLYISDLKVDEIIYGSTNIIDFIEAMHLPTSDAGYESLTHPHRMKIEDLERLVADISKLSYEERMPLYPAEPYYMWAADKAIMNVLELSSRLGLSTVIPTNENISSGIFSNLYIHQH